MDRKENNFRVAEHRVVPLGCAEYRTTPILLEEGSREEALNDRRVKIAFSSEAPVERFYGNEILDHAPKSVRMDRVNSGMPLLVQHDHSDLIGVVERVTIDSDKIGRATVRFGKSDRASEILRDVADGIRRSVSVGYIVHRASEDKKTNTVRVTDWEPFEVSFVTVPADTNVGVGRNYEVKQMNTEIENKENTRADVPVDMPNTSRETLHLPKEPERRSADISISEESYKRELRREEEFRAKEIRAMGEQFKQQDLASKLIASGGSVDEMRAHLLENLGASKTHTENERYAEIGIPPSEAQQFSFRKLIAYQSFPNESRLRNNAAFEIECCKESDRSSNGAGLRVPHDVLTAPATRELASAMRVQRAALSTDNSDALVGTETLGGSFIEHLYANTVVKSLGATTLSGLRGNLSIPRQIGGTEAAWVAEGLAVPGVQQKFDQIPLTPRMLGAFTEYTRRFLEQDSIDTEAFIRNDLSTAVAVSIDKTIINGSGAKTPTGIMQTDDINVVSTGANGGAIKWDHIVDLETMVADANTTMNGFSYLTTPKAKGALKKITKFGDNSIVPIWGGLNDNNTMNGYAANASNVVPSNLESGTGTRLSAMVAGKWSDVILALWSGVDILVNPYALDTQGGVRVTILQDVDVAIRRPRSFSVIKNIKTA